MKGSPILATALACLIMLGMYVGMRVAFSEDDTPAEKPEISQENPLPSHQVSVYAEIYFSSQPVSFTLTHPATGKVLLKVDSTEANELDSEWSGDISIPVKKLTSSPNSTTALGIDILGSVKWKSTGDNYQFMQVIISPDELDPQTRTLRALGDITDVMNFHWKENK